MQGRTAHVSFHEESPKTKLTTFKAQNPNISNKLYFNPDPKFYYTLGFKEKELGIFKFVVFNGTFAFPLCSGSKLSGLS